MRRREDYRVRRVRTVLNHISPEERKEIVTALEMLMHASLAMGTEKTPHGNHLVGMHRRGEELNISKVIS